MTAPSATAVPTRPAPAGRAGLLNVTRSEWTKLWSVRSTGWTLLALVVATIGFGVLVCWGTESHVGDMSVGQRTDFDAASTSLTGLAFGQLAIAVLGVLLITSEYSTGGIRTSLTAVPRRLRLLSAKTLVFAVVSLVVGLITSFAAFLCGQAVLALAGLQTGLGDPGVVRAVVGGGLFIAASGLFGLALGALLRHTAFAVTLAVADCWCCQA